MKKTLYIYLLLIFNIGFVFGQDCEIKFNTFLDDLGQSTELSEAIFVNPELVDSWKILENAHSKSYLKTDINRLKTFNTLSPENQKLIAQFTDEGANSTLAKFVDDINNDAEFLDFVNLPENQKYVEGITNHKNFTDTDADDIGDLIGELQSQPQNTVKLENWLERSTKINRIKNRFAMGRKFETDILNSVKTRTGTAYAELLKKIPDLNERKLISQMHFCLPPHIVPCTAEGQYFIADQVWVKYNDRDQIVDMAIIDTKLSSKSGITDGQVIAKQNVGSSLMYKQNRVRNQTETIDESDLPNTITQRTDIPLSNFYILEGNGSGNLEDFLIK